MDNKKLENLVNTTFEILCEQNKDIKRYEKEKGKIKKSLIDSNNNEVFLKLEAADDGLTNSLLKEKKDYFFKHMNNFIGIHILSGKIKDCVMKELNEDCYGETENIVGNLVYNECLEETRKLEEKIKRSFSDEENEKFVSYLDLLVDITGEKNCLFFEAMLQTGEYLNKIKGITEV